MALSSNKPGRYCAVHELEEIQALEPGMDFRRPEYRREVFLRFYEFHLKYRAHPGCVYYLMPYLAKRHGWDEESRLWYAFLNGNTQNPVTSWIIFREFPSVHSLDVPRLTAWFNAEWDRLEFDTDRRYHKKNFLPAVQAYRALLAGQRQVDYFASLPTPERSYFRSLWECRKQFYSFGRLSMFSYSEYLRIMGLPLDCEDLFLRDLDGSKSHRNGLCKVLGRDDLDWHDSNPAFPGYSEEILVWLEEEAHLLRAEAFRRVQGQDYAADAGYFTLESALCTYKSWHRPNRRYPNVYNDMLVLRIQRAERAWGERFQDFWAARQQYLPRPLRWEDNPNDPGLTPRKQNHYLHTGQVIMMDLEWPCFKNDLLLEGA
jgi:hypothetical protein